MNPTGEKPLTVSQLRERHPFPWQYRILPGTAVVVTFDAKGIEVPMFLMLDFVCGITLAVSRAPEQAAV